MDGNVILLLVIIHPFAHARLGNEFTKSLCCSVFSVLKLYSVVI